MKAILQSKFTMFIVFLVILLAGIWYYRLDMADKDHALIMLECPQSRLAAESGIMYSIAKMNTALSKKENLQNSITELINQDWIPISNDSKAKFRISYLRKNDNEENGQTIYKIVSEGKYGSHLYTCSAILLQEKENIVLKSLKTTLDY